MLQCSCFGLKLLHKSPQPLGVTSYLQYFPSNPPAVFFFFSVFLPTAITLEATCEMCPIAERHVGLARAARGDGRRREVRPPPLLLDSCRTASQKAATCYKFSLKRLFV